MPWSLGLSYSRAGLDLCQRNPRPFVTLPGIFLLPIALALLIDPPAWLGFLLTSVTVVGGHLSLLVAVDEASSGGRPQVGPVLTRSIGHLPRYLLTNAQTTVFFWAPVLPLVTLVNRVADGRPWWVGVALWIPLVAFGLTWHLQTLFAPYLAICDGLSPTQAVLEGFRLVRGRVGTAAVTFVTAAAFAGIPSLLVVGALYAIAGRDGPGAIDRFDRALPYLVTGLIEVIRPVLVAAVHRLYEDLRPAPAAALREAL